MLLPSVDIHFKPYAEKGYYQRSALMLALSTVKSWRVAVDIGAHVGFMANDMARMFDTVYAFEPQHDNYECLKSNKSRNVFSYNCAIGKKAGRIGLVNPLSTNSGAWECIDGDDAEVRSLDSFELQNVGFIKIDVQGHELDVLKGAKETIKTWKPTIMVEVRKEEAQSLKSGKEIPPAVRYLADMGAKLVFVAGDDMVMSW